jgi:hypothetical protein
VNVFYVGHGEDEVSIDKLEDHQEARRPSTTRPWPPSSSAESVSQSVASLPIPKGIDPLRPRAPRPR